MIFFLLASFFAVSAYRVFAIPPISPYYPGETLNPTCAPGDVECTVGILESRDEGGSLTFQSTVLDFVGAGVTATEAGGVVTVTVAGGISGLTNGTTTITSGTDGAVLFQDGGVLSQDGTNFFWDNATDRLGIGTNSPSYTLDISGTGRLTGNLTLGSVLSTSGLATFMSGINVNSETITDFTGTGLSLSGGALTLSTTGDWTGTFDAQEGAYYLSRANHTGSQLASTISDFSTSVQGLIDTSAELVGILTDETGSGALVFGTSPSLVAPTLSGTISGTYTLAGTPTLGANLALGGATRTIGDTGGISITTAGNVGIGDTTPASLFTVGNGDLFQVDTNGDIVKLKNLTYSWPSSHVAGVLKNNGSGTLSWSALTSSDVTDLSTNYLALDQTTPQTVSNGAPNFSGGMGIGMTHTGTSRLEFPYGTTTAEGISFGAIKFYQYATTAMSLTQDLRFGAGTGVANLNTDYGELRFNTSTPNYFSRNRADGTSLLLMKNQHASATGNFIDFENSSAQVASITRDGNFLVGNGTAALPSLSFAGDTDNGMYLSGTNELSFSTLGTQRITLASGGNVGIGTTNPGNLLHVYQSGTGFQVPVMIQNPGDPGNGSTRFVVQNSVSSFYLQAYGSSAPGALASAASIWAMSGSKLLLGAGSGMGVQLASNNDYSNPQFTLTSTGNVGIGDTTPDYKLDVEADIADFVASVFNDGNVNTRKGLLVQSGVDDHTAVDTSTLMEFRDGDGTTVGSVTFGSSVTSYNTTSDERLKTDIEETSIGLEDLMRIQVRDYTWRADKDSKISHGFIAQELYEIYPSAVTVPVDNDGFWMVDYSKLMPLVVKSVQDLYSTVHDFMSLDVSNPHSVLSIIKNFLADAGNSIDTIFARVFKGDRAELKTLCLDDVCITKDELQRLLDANSIQNTGEGNSDGGENGTVETQEESTDILPEDTEEGSTGTDSDEVDDEIVLDDDGVTNVTTELPDDTEIEITGSEAEVTENIPDTEDEEQEIPEDSSQYYEVTDTSNFSDTESDDTSL